MACTFPMFRLSWSEHLNYRDTPHRIAKLYERRVHNDGVILQRPEAEIIKKEYPYLGSLMQQVPCGKCINCRLAYSRDWANRCMAELKTAQNAYFLTLTYDNEHLEFAPYVDPETGVLETRPVLVPEHLQRYLKRIRRAAERRGFGNIRFFACGEYGEETQRPHYHVILYNVPNVLIDKPKKWCDSTPEAPLWYSDTLSRFWPYGYTVFGDVNWETCAYVARYITKKQLGKSKQAQEKAQEQFFPDFPWVPEFVRMSRNPGIGREYFEAHKDEIYRTDELFVPIKGIIQAVRPAKYYDRLYDIDHHTTLRCLKRSRSIQAENSMLATLTTTSLSEVEYLEQKDATKLEQSRRLLRPTI